MHDPMKETAKVKLTKLEAAQNQLDCAIELWFRDEIISAHTLAAAAHQIIHDINKRQHGPSLLFDSEIIKDEYRSQFISLMTRPTNFLKHADRDPEDTIEYIPMGALIFILMATVGLGNHFKMPWSDNQLIFINWLAFHHPEYINQQYRSTFFKDRTEEELVTVRELNKRDFFELSLRARIEARANSQV